MMSAPVAWVEAPLRRRSAIHRLEMLLERYERILEWFLGDRDTRRRIGRDLLLRHPSALREAMEIDAIEAGERQTAARIELERVRGAAPLPPPELAGRRIHALSELGPLMLEVRRLRRGRTEGGSDLDPDHDAIRADLIALAERPPAEHLGTLVAWLAERYRVPRWWTWVWGPRGAEVDVGAASDFPLGVPRRVQGPDGPVLVLARPEGWYAASAECPHRGGDLTEGEVEGTTVICPVHAWAFSLVDGTTPADPRCRLPLYEVREVEGRVLVRAVPE